MITVEQADEAALRQLLPLYRAAAAEPDCPWDEFYPDAATLRADCDAGLLYCARDTAGQVLGGFALADDPETQALPCWDDALLPAGEIVRLVVAPSVRGQGLGRKLLAAGMQELAARGYSGCRILVAKNNTRALRAYAPLGFTLAGQAYLYDVDFLCYEKALNNI